ncbi:MAG: hypothetical protein ACR2OG_13445 [Gemmatimonadaceae bacterium]
MDSSDELRSLVATPGHLAEPGELIAFQRLVLLGVRSGWAMSLVAPFAVTGVFVSDGWAELRLEAEEQLAALSQALGRSTA